MRDPGPVMDAAAAFLSVRPRSVAETRRRLIRLGYPASLVEEVITRLVDVGFLDDADFARAWIESRDRSRPRGEIGLRRELALKGVPREITDELLSQRAAAAGAAGADIGAALVLLERRRVSLERESNSAIRRNKAYALLARNGFDPETCREAVREAFA